MRASLISLVLVVASVACTGAPASNARVPVVTEPAPGDVFVAVPQAGVDINVAGGRLHGAQQDALRVFRGIPFAEPPIGELRFRAPVPLAPWTGTRDATAFGPSCPQQALGPALGDAANTFSEDCLSLNVWAHDDDVKRPVMVFIYGGGFILGASNWPTYEASALADRADAVVVSFNYRLGALGFLATEEMAAESGVDAAGNWGIQDQILALRWVKENIAAFGGDPDNVTIFGESAGAISVCALLGSPSADDLYAKAIIESGMCTLATLRGPGPLGMPSTIDGGEAVVESVGCADAFDRLACLRSLPATDLVGASSLTNILTGDIKAIAALSPAVDGATIPAQPLGRLQSGAVDKPLIVGSNHDEGILFTSTDVVLTRWDLRNRIAGIVGDTPLADDVTDLYPISEFLLPKDAWIAFMGEVSFICPGLAAASAASPGAPSFTYHFTRTPLVAAAVGAAHGIELPYVFGSFASLGIIPLPGDTDLSNAMQTAWGAFAHDGNPGWRAYDPAAPYIEILDGELSGTDEIRNGRCDALRALGVEP